MLRHCRIEGWKAISLCWKQTMTHGYCFANRLWVTNVYKYWYRQTIRAFSVVVDCYYAYARGPSWVFRYGTWGKSYSNMMQWAVFWLNGNCLKVCPCSVLLYFLSKRSDYLVLLAIWHLATTQSHQRMDQNKIYQNKNVYTRSERTSERANKWANHTHICFVGRGRSKTIIFINCSINSIIDFRTNRIYVVNGISLMCDVNFVFYAVN